ncbi:MAG: hypothetical protein ABGY11_00050 [Candidatus Thioglobus sp.]
MKKFLNNLNLWTALFCFWTMLVHHYLGMNILAVLMFGLGLVNLGIYIQQVRGDKDPED